MRTGRCTECMSRSFIISCMSTLNPSSILSQGFLNSAGWGYRGGSPTAVQAWRPCHLWEPSPSHHIVSCILCCLLFVGFPYFCGVFSSVLWHCWLGLRLLTCKTVSQMTYTVLVETLNPAQSIVESINLKFCEELYHRSQSSPGDSHCYTVSSFV